MSNFIPKDLDFTIRQVGDEKYDEQLHTPSEDVDIVGEWKNGGLGNAIIQMKKILSGKPIIKGLAAPQVGINKRFFIIQAMGSATTYINPLIDKVYDPRISIETCQSCSNDTKEYVTVRYNTIDVYYTTPGVKKKAVGVRLSGRIALEFQRCYDILCGIYLADEDGIAMEYTDDIKLLSDEQKKDIVKRYRNGEFDDLIKEYQEKNKNGKRT